MLRLAAIALLIMSPSALADHHKKKEKRGHKAHTHGATTLDMVVTGKTAEMDFRGPSESLFGFEHSPKSAKDKKTVKDQLDKLKARANELIKFPADRACQTTIGEVETFVEEGHVHDDHGHHDKKKGHDDHHDHHDKKKGHDHHDKHDGEHSEFHIKLKAACKNNIAGAELTFGFASVFPRVKTLKVQVLTETGQFGKSVKQNNDKLKI